MGYWLPGFGFQKLDAGRWHDTGDIVRRDGAGGNDLTFVARIDDSFKLANGRFVAAGVMEARIRDRFPGATDNLLLFSRDGETLEIAADMELPPDAVVSGLGSMRSLLSGVHTIETSGFARTPKGALNRRATFERICRQLHKSA